MPPNSWVAHYFRDGWSLCGIRYTPKYLAEDGEYRENDCCIQCRRALIEKAAAPAVQVRLPLGE